MDFIYDPSLVLYVPVHDGDTFASKDAYGHLCTVTDALWTPNGRYFNGSSAFIQLGQDLFESDYSGTIIIWATMDAQGATDRIFSSSDINGTNHLVLNMLSTNKFRLEWFENGGATINRITGDTTLAAKTFYMLTVTSNGAAWSLYVNDGAAEGLTVSGLNTGDWFANLEAVMHDVRIGRLERSGGDAFHTGYIGEVWVYNRPLTPQEIQHNYLATKYRYR